MVIKEIRVPVGKVYILRFLLLGKSSSLLKVASLKANLYEQKKWMSFGDGIFSTCTRSMVLFLSMIRVRVKL